MTGFGEARYQGDALSLSVELRALNNRYLKVTLRAPDPYHLLEAEVEKVIRRTVKRGTLQVHVRIDKAAAAQDFRINTVALASYYQQIRTWASQSGLQDHGPALLAQLLPLPGVVDRSEERRVGKECRSRWSPY